MPASPVDNDVLNCIGAVADRAPGIRDLADCEEHVIFVPEPLRPAAKGW